MGSVPGVERDQQKVRDQIYDEEAAFLRTLKRGITLFNRIAVEMRKTGRTVVSGDDAYTLHDTHGVLIDITQQMAGEHGFTVDMAGYEEAMNRAKDKAREGGKKFAVSAVQGALPPTDDAPKYRPEAVTARVLGWVKDNGVVTSGKLTAGNSVALLLDRTNFYGEQGGQIGDSGTIRSAGGADFDVEDAQRLGDTVLHIGTLHDGELAVGDTVEVMQTTTRRIAIMRNHTATHRSTSRSARCSASTLSKRVRSWTTRRRASTSATTSPLRPKK